MADYKQKCEITIEEVQGRMDRFHIKVYNRAFPIVRKANKCFHDFMQFLPKMDDIKYKRNQLNKNRK